MRSVIADGPGAAGREDTSGVPALIELFKERSPKLVWQAERELLHWVAGYEAPKPVSGTCTEAERQACLEAWASGGKKRAASCRWTRFSSGDASRF